MIEGRNVNALADSGGQVNTIMPAFVRQYGFPVLPLEDLVNHPLNLVGLGGKHTSPLRFIILRVQVREITGYDENVVFHMVPDESEFGHRVPLVIGTCTIGRIINVMITPQKVGEGQPREPRPLPPEFMFSMHTHTSKMAVAKFHSWLGTCLRVTSCLRRECWWRELYQHHQCHLQSCCQRWKLL